MKIAVLLSGGVDSSVALDLAKQVGDRDITAFYLKIWSTHVTIAVFAFTITEFNFAFGQTRPFPQHVTYAAGAIKPSQVTQADLDGVTQAFYNQWKARYLVNGCETNQYYVWHNAEGISQQGSNSVSISEGHGYGMMITALMAGYDPNAKVYFDGLYRYFTNHFSLQTDYLMAWNQVKPRCTNDVNGQFAATDGDLDIGYALLLADQQWGSAGPINYQREAANVIAAILRAEVNQTNGSLKLGDWLSDQVGPYDTRPSDFMMDHFRAFQTATGDTNWGRVIDKCYELVNRMQTRFSPSAGLLPDFIRHTDTNAAPAEANFLEGPHDGEYFYNACRTPWRIGTDYLVSGDGRAFAALGKMNQWVRTKTGEDPANLYAGYTLAGEAYANYNALAFTAPFAVSAMVDSTNQPWLNALWRAVAGRAITEDDYYGNSIKMLCLIVVSGNWWTPQSEQGGEPNPLPLHQVQSWAYQIQELNAPGAIEALTGSRYDLLVVDPVRTSWSSLETRQFDTKSMVKQLKASVASDGRHRKLVVAYIDIGEAENWRWYWTWSQNWTPGQSRPSDWPAYIVGHDPDGWSGNFPVTYWSTEWKDIVIHGRNHSPTAERDYQSIIDETIRDGFDGIYLDWVEGYTDSNVVAAATSANVNPALEMIAFIGEMRTYARQRNPDFLVIQQNAGGLLEGHPELLQVIDGIAKEHVWYRGEADVDWNNANGYDQMIATELSQEFITELRRFQAAGIPVLNVEYTVGNASKAYELSRIQRFIAYCSRSSLSRLTTTPPPVRLSLLTFSNGQPMIETRGQPNYSYILEASTDLANWTSIVTNQMADGVFQFVDSSATQSKLRFYRAMSR